MQVGRALISVFDKTGLDVFARGLNDLGIEIVASGGSPSSASPSSPSKS